MPRRERTPCTTNEHLIHVMTCAQCFDGIVRYVNTLKEKKPVPKAYRRKNQPRTPKNQTGEQTV